jgi:hypothetical protein
MSKHQAISDTTVTVDGIELTMSATELFSVLHCASKLASIEGMHGTAERLATDAALVRRYSKDIKTIKVTS